MDQNPASSAAFVLLATYQERSLATLLDAQGYAVIQSPNGAHALKWARTVRPDLIVLEEELPDISGTAVCRLLRGDPEIGQNVPVLIVTADAPTPEQRVAALSAGAWDILRLPGDGDLALRMDAYIQAKRSMDVALADTSIIPPTALYGRGGLTRRARELGALMVRCRAPLACIVFDLESEPADPRLGSVIAHAARISDVVGVLSPHLFGLVAPATSDAGAVMLARRVASAMTAMGNRNGRPPLRLHAGFEVANLAYDPMDPGMLLARAEHAVRSGRPEAEFPWLRRHDLLTSHFRVVPQNTVSERRSLS